MKSLSRSITIALFGILVSSIPSNVRAQVLITEIMYNTALCFDSQGEWIELYNAGTQPVDTTDWELDVFTDGRGPTTLTAGIMQPGQYHIIGRSADGCGGLSADQVADFEIENFPSFGSGDSIELFDNTGFRVDQIRVDDPTTPDISIQRRADANNFPIDTDRSPVDRDDFGDWEPGPVGGTPRGNYTPATSLDTCGANATRIHNVQGSGLISPLVGQNVIVEAVVTTDFTGSDRLSGFYVQEEDNETDGDALTSEGIFISTAIPSGFISTGALVRISGTVAEVENETVIDASTINTCTSTTTNVSIPSVSVLDFPVITIADLEAFEGMLVQNTQSIVISSNENLGQEGQLSVSFGQRNFAPTDSIGPGPQAVAAGALNRRNTLIIDDDTSTENSPSVPFINGNRVPRAGDTRTGFQGVLGQSSAGYLVRTDGTLTFNESNPRPSSPVVAGRLKIAAVNVSRYFVTINPAPTCGFLNCSGATSPAELVRQRDKLADLFREIDADIIGIVEIQDDQGASLNDLTNAINDAVGPGTYTQLTINTTNPHGDTVGFIYKTSAVSLASNQAVFDENSDPNYGPENRPSMAQAFREVSTNEEFILVLTNLVSRDNPCTNPDQQDGQQECSIERTASANALADWITLIPTGNTDPDVLIMGTLNAFRLEDPIDKILSAGYIDSIGTRATNPTYTIVTNQGFAGSLDHALATPSLDDQITDAFEWHVNADESQALDYNDFNPPNLYQPTRFRASAHDPLIIGLNLASADAGIDAGVDAGIDAGDDIGVEDDVGIDAAIDDIGIDAGNDIGVEDAADVGNNNGVDAADVGNNPINDVGNNNNADAADVGNNPINDVGNDQDASTPDVGVAVDAGTKVDSVFAPLTTCQSVPFTDFSILSLFLSMGLGYIKRRKNAAV